MKAAIRQHALELGFDACRVTHAAAPETEGWFRRWLDEGRHGDMTYLERNADKRIDPQRVLPGVLSVITLAAAYGPSDGEVPSGKLGGADSKAPFVRIPSVPEGVVARYARARDYHHVLKAPLKKLVEFISGLAGPAVRSLAYVDTGPILEKDLGQRAGLGFVGKHTNLIHRRLGNWFLLSEILTTLHLEPDPAEPNRCGSCERCLQACPTGALTGPFRMDARLCIAYLTIEHRGIIPEPLRPLIGDRVFGCDDCLEVCPWNRWARSGRLMRECYRGDLSPLDLMGLLALDEEGFQQRFAGTPIRRAKRQGLLRNACIALGNLAEPRARPALERAAGDGDPIVAEHARWAIQQVDSRGTSAETPLRTQTGPRDEGPRAGQTEDGS